MLENVVEMLKENDLRMKSIGRKEGRKEGREEGRSEGKKEGIKEGINKVLTNMLAKGMTVDQIKEITGLSSKEIEQATS